MSTVLAIDPGTTESAYVVLASGELTTWGKVDNADALAFVELAGLGQTDTFAIEGIASYGMAVGAEVFTTAEWTGRFIQAWAQHRGETALKVFRREVKLHHCGVTNAKDGNVRQAIIDRFGGKEAAIGRKATPGPLYGVKADCWQALALGLLVHDGAVTA